MRLSESERLARRKATRRWHRQLRDRLCASFEAIEAERFHDIYNNLSLSDNEADGENSQPKFQSKFQPKRWRRREDGQAGGGGEMRVMRGRVFEKVGVNISTVYGVFRPELRREVQGAASDGRFWASGVSVVVHPRSPLVPAAHFNARYIDSAYGWFGGGGDLTPHVYNSDTKRARDQFHQAFQSVCDGYDPDRYRAFSRACDDYFYLPHRRRARGVGGVFFDNLHDDWQRDFAFVQELCVAFLQTYPQIVRERFAQRWNARDRQAQLRVRGLYAEFNLIYDRGTRFGLLTQAEPEAVLMSLPPLASW